MEQIKQTTNTLLTRYLDEYEQFYIRRGLSFGAKQKETYEQSFWIDYKQPRGSYERSRIAWNFWDRKKGDN